MSKATERTLFSVIEITNPDGEKYTCVNWHHDLLPALDEINPNGQTTDKIIDIADDLVHHFDDDEEVS